jgi:hypothetical protein
MKMKKRKTVQMEINKKLFIKNQVNKRNLNIQYHNNEEE